MDAKLTCVGLGNIKSIVLNTLVVPRNHEKEEIFEW